MDMNWIKLVVGGLLSATLASALAQEGEKLVPLPSLEGKRITFMGPPLTGDTMVQARGDYLYLNVSGTAGRGSLSGRYKVLAERGPFRGEVACATLRMYDVCVQVFSKSDESRWIRLSIDGAMTEHSIKVE